MCGRSILEKLVRINTVNPPGNELDAAKCLEELLGQAGFKCEIHKISDTRANLIAVLGNNTEKELILNGHLDVVPVTEGWRTNPFQVFEKNGLLYGRGTADMKGGIAAMCAAAIRVAKEGIDLKGRLQLVFVADEEDANLGLHRLMQDKKLNYSNMYVVIGEPTELQVGVAHRGVARHYIDIKGIPRHAALSADEGDAVRHAADAIQTLYKENVRLAETHHTILPPPSISITMIQGYQKDNIVPGVIRLLTDFRILPGMQEREVRELLIDILARKSIEAVVSPLFFMPGGEIDISDFFVKECLSLAEDVLGRNRQPTAFSASCEQCFWCEKGAKALIIGPGSLRQAHTDDEYVSCEQIEAAEEFYYKMIRRILE